MRRALPSLRVESAGAQWLPLAVVAAALVYDPSVEAALPKLVLALVLAVVLAASSVAGALRGTRAHGAPSSAALALTAYAAWVAVAAAWGDGTGVLDAGLPLAAAAVALTCGALGAETVLGTVPLACWLVGVTTGAWVLVQAAFGARGVALHGGHGNANWTGLVLAVAALPALAWAFGPRHPPAPAPRGAKERTRRRDDDPTPSEAPPNDDRHHTSPHSPHRASPAPGYGGVFRGAMRAGCVLLGIGLVLTESRTAQVAVLAGLAYWGVARWVSLRGSAHGALGGAAEASSAAVGGAGAPNAAARSAGAPSAAVGGAGAPSAAARSAGAPSAAVGGAGAQRLGLVAAPFVFAGVAVLTIARLGPSLPTSTSATLDSLAGRAWIWETSLDAALAALPFGSGTGAFEHAFLAAQAPALVGLPPDTAAARFHDVLDAHDDWLHTLTTTGPLGLGLLVAALALALAGHLRGRRFALAGALVTLVFAATGDTAFLRPAVALLAALLLGTAGAEPTPSHTSTRGARWTGGGQWLGRLPLSVALGKRFWFAGLAQLVVTAWWVGVGGRAWLGERLATEADQLEPLLRVAALEQAFTLAPRSARVASQLGLAQLETHDPERAAKTLERALALRPSVAGWLALGHARSDLGEATAAESAVRRALAVHPGSFRAHVALATLLVNRGALDDAAVHLSRARDLYPGDPAVAELAERLARARQDAAVSDR